MYYEIHGSDTTTPLVLIHGGGSTIETTFGNILPLLARNHKIIAVELQAHGRTSDRDAPLPFRQDADDVAALLEYLKVDEANFLGFSNGGTTTLQIAIRHPQIVNKIVVVSANYRKDGMIAGFYQGLKNATLDDMPKPLKEAYLKVTPKKDDLQVMFEKDKERMLNFKNIPDEALQSINAPALLMSSDHDVVKPEHTVKMSHLIPNGRLIILPGTHGSFIGAVEARSKYFKKESGKILGITLALIDEFLN